MTDITVDRLKEIAALADELPDEYRVAAFSELVRHELGGTKPSRSDHQIQKSREQARSEAENASIGDGLPDWFDEVLGAMPEAHVAADATRDVQAAWCVAELFRRGDEATSTTIRKLIEDDLGSSPQSPSHTSDTLADLTPRYVSRAKEGRGYVYKPTRHMSELFRDSDD